MRRRGWRGGLPVPVVALCVCGLALPGPGAGQATGGGADPAGEAGALAAALDRESAGDLQGAERLLTGVAADRPGSVPALVALERVLRIQGRLDRLPALLRAGLEEEPSSPILNRMLLRTLAGLERDAELETAARAWIDLAPGVEAPYREAARAWLELGDAERARGLLEEGRHRIPRADALALELGDAYAALGEPALALREWERAIGEDAAGMAQVRRRLRSLPDGGAGLLGDLVEALAAGNPMPGRLEAALDLAIDAGLEARARDLGRSLLTRQDRDGARRLLVRIARRADGARMHGLAYWAYGRLLDLEGGPTFGEGDAGTPERARLLAIEERMAELALLVGDTAAAAARLGRVERSLEPGSAGRRTAATQRIRLLADRDADSAAAALRAFRTEHPDASELDEVSAAVAAALAREGHGGEADRALAGVRGPRSSAIRGRLALERGDAASARAAFAAAAAGLEGAEATAALELATLLRRVSDEAAAAIGEALARAEGGDPGAAVDGLAERAWGLDSEERPAVLAFAAGLADDAGLAEDGRGLRRRIVAEHPRAPEAPAALLAVARSLRGEDKDGVEARELLERLIVEYPGSALVHQARRELDALSRTTGGGADGRSGR